MEVLNYVSNLKSWVAANRPELLDVPIREMLQTLLEENEKGDELETWVSNMNVHPNETAEELLKLVRHQ